MAAGASYASVGQAWLYLSGEDVRTAASGVVAPEAHDQLLDQLVEDLTLLQDRLGDASGTVWYVVAPLATRLESYSDNHAVVQVWVVRMLSADGVAVPQASWRTVSFELVWRDDWKVAALAETEGPTPQLEAGAQPWASGYLDETLNGFVRVGVQ